MPAILKGLSGIYAGCQIEVGAQPIVIGRDPAQAHLIIPETQAEVSGRHMSISFDSMRQVFLIVDTSTNGTFLMSGERMIQNQPCPLRSGMRFYLSNTNTSFEVEVTGSLPPVSVDSGQGQSDYPYSARPQQLGYPGPALPQQAACCGTPSNHAGFWKRVPAYLIDGVMLTVVAIIPLILIFQLDYADCQTFSRKLLLTQLIFVFLNWLYSALMESSKQQGTLGKMAMGIKVTDLYGRPVSFSRATGRFLCKILVCIIPVMGWLGIAYMMAGWTERKQALHDMMTGCLVENK